MAKGTYSIYVIELSRRVFNENRKFREANPQFNGVVQCLYVGITSKTPRERFDQHISGHISKRGFKISSRIVEKYGMYLRPSLYSHLDKFSKAAALEMEKELANTLRRKGYAVWYN